MLTSKQSFNTYSKFEIRCKIPKGNRLFPAFWVFGWSTEIDVFEFWDWGRAEEFKCSLHYWDENGVDNSMNQNWDSNIALSESFNTYSVEYDSFYLKFYFNNNLISTFSRLYDSKGKPVNSCYIPKGKYLENPLFPRPGNPLNVIANLAVQKNGIANSNTMVIDYIKVYQRNPKDGFEELCGKIIGPTQFCNKNMSDTLEYCFEGNLKYSPVFSATDNIEIVQNPSYELVKIDTSIIINKILIDTFYFDTTYHYGCIKITPRNIRQNDWGTIYVNTKNECEIEPLNIKFGFPYPNISATFGTKNPCLGEIAINVSNYKEYPPSTKFEWFILDKGNLPKPPTFPFSLNTNSRTLINLPQGGNFQNSFFIVGLKVITECDTIEVSQKIQLSDKDCRGILFIVTPNPSTGLVTVQLQEPDKINNIKKLYIRNYFTNEIVYTKENLRDINDLNLDLSHLTNSRNSMYIISLETLESNLSSRIFTIMK